MSSISKFILLKVYIYLIVPYFINQQVIKYISKMLNLIYNAFRKRLSIFEIAKHFLNTNYFENAYKRFGNLKTLRTYILYSINRRYILDQSDFYK